MWLSIPRVLPSYLNLNIRDICDCGFIDNNKNHCAHFVSHVLGFTFGYKCNEIANRRDLSGVNVRVFEIWNKCPSVGEWKDKPDGNVLAFVTASKNVNLRIRYLANVGAKHIGIFYNGMIYHYANTKDKVVCVTPEQFAKHYRGSNIKVFYGTFPV